MEEEMIKDVAHTGRGSSCSSRHAKNNSTQKVEREKLEREFWGNNKVPLQVLALVAERLLQWGARVWVDVSPNMQWYHGYC